MEAVRQSVCLSPPNPVPCVGVRTTVQCALIAQSPKLSPVFQREVQQHSWTNHTTGSFGSPVGQGRGNLTVEFSQQHVLHASFLCRAGLVIRITTGRSRVRILLGAKDLYLLQSVPTGCGVHPVSSSVVTAILFPG